MLPFTTQNICNTPRAIHRKIDNLPVAIRVYDTDPTDYRYEIGYPIGYTVIDESSAQDEDEDEEINKPRAVKHYIFNHLKFRVMIHSDPVIAGSRIVGFEVEPFSVKHKFNSNAKISSKLTTCTPARPVDTAAEPQSTDVEGEITYTYDVEWKESDIKWSNRWELYLKGNPDDQIHWFSILNSTLIVFFLTVRSVSVA